MYQITKLVLLVVLLAEFVNVIYCPNPAGPIELAHKDHKHDPAMIKILEDVSEQCKTKFYLQDQEDWKKAIEFCIQDTNYNNSETTPFLENDKYAAEYTHDDMCFHHCVLRELNILSPEKFEIAGTDNQRVLASVYRLNFHKLLNYSDTGIQDIYLFDQRGIGILRSKSGGQHIHDCDKAAMMALQTIYEADIYDTQYRRNRNQPPWNNPQCAYGNLVSFCFRNNMGDLYTNAKLYIECLHREGIWPITNNLQDKYYIPD